MCVPCGWPLQLLWGSETGEVWFPISKESKEPLVISSPTKHGRQGQEARGPNVPACEAWDESAKGSSCLHICPWLFTTFPPLNLYLCRSYWLPRSTLHEIFIKCFRMIFYTNSISDYRFYFYRFSRYQLATVQGRGSHDLISVTVREPCKAKRWKCHLQASLTRESVKVTTGQWTILQLTSL